jgi:capsular polysaccharide biosynthesis protein
MVRLPPRLRPLFPYLKPAYTTATRLVAPASGWLSRRRGGALPTGVVATLEQAATSSGGRCVVARPSEPLSRGTHLGWPKDLPPLEPARDDLVGRVAVAELPNARVLGRHKAVITGAGDLVQEVSAYFGTTRWREHPLFLNPFPGRPVDVDGRLGVLASRGDGNYYHFLIDVLPRLGVLEQAAGIAPPDRWYVPARTRFQRELLDLVGISAELRIDADEVAHVRARCLVVPGLPATTEKNPPWVVEFLRARLLPATAGSGGRRHIYVTRGTSANNRAIVNEADLVALLTARGFTVVDPGAMSVTDQIETFARASLIVSGHGAALANLVFASPGSAVIEIFPPGAVLPDYWRLASGVPGLTYRYLSAWPDSPVRHGRASAIVTDIVVDLGALSSLLDALGD